ncbi:MAG: hypothetical protein H7Z21_16065 [Hymenobacter sp.]|nr:hypothetical protein [Hymenobacter sp.]
MNWLRWQLTNQTVSNITPGSRFQLQLPAAVVAMNYAPSGYEHDAAEARMPDATIRPQHHYNLAEMGLSWHENVEAEPESARFVEQIKQEIRGVKVEFCLPASVLVDGRSDYTTGMKYPIHPTWNSSAGHSQFLLAV